jgi:hypothetical protein
MMSKKLTRASLYPLEKYAEIRPQFRAKVMEHKRNRNIQLGDHVTLHFEDALTMQYQVQEMLRVERIFEAAGIEEELQTYNPLIPDGSNLKATFMIEYPEVEQRKQALARLIGIEDKVWVQIDGFEPVYAIADEDLDRETEDKTSSVHFLRFEFSSEQRAAAKSGAEINIGIDHDDYRVRIAPLPAAQRDALAADLD